MDAVGYFKKQTNCYFKKKRCFSCVFLGYKSTHCRRKNKNLEKKKSGTFKNKDIQFPVENKNKRFNDRIKVCDISFLGKTLKSKVYLLLNTSNLFGSDCIVLFDL